MQEPKSLDPLTEGVIAPQMRPICQHCGTDPVPIAANLIGLEGAFSVVFFCGVCRKVLGVSALPDPAPRVNGPSTGLIVRPS